MRQLIGKQVATQLIILTEAWSKTPRHSFFPKIRSGFSSYNHWNPKWLNHQPWLQESSVWGTIYQSSLAWTSCRGLNRCKIVQKSKFKISNFNLAPKPSQVSKLLRNRLDDVIDEVWRHLWRHQLPEYFHPLRVAEGPDQDETGTKQELFGGKFQTKKLPLINFTWQSWHSH